MIRKILSSIGLKKKNTQKYKGFSDFFMNASDAEKKEVFAEAARKANEDQFKVFQKAQVKMKSN